MKTTFVPTPTIAKTLNMQQKYSNLDKKDLFIVSLTSFIHLRLLLLVLKRKDNKVKPEELWNMHHLVTQRSMYPLATKFDEIHEPLCL